MTGFDSKRQMAAQKLYNVPKNSTIVLKEGIEMTFHHIDGAYSVCTDEEGNVYHISASEEVEVKPKEES